MDNMKIVLNSGKEFFATSVFNNAENQITIALAGIESYDSARAEFTPEAMQELRHYVSEDTYIPYEGYTQYVETTRVTELEDGKEVAFVFQKPSKTEIQLGEIATLREQISLMQDALNDLILNHPWQIDL
ncbi:hypothetical protein HNQ56_004432 [Anaerotaenia torta]|uniref:hypothetical protein n=1 Tax=Anaerotaenia torta TaxID=433293 RepID=UPI003D21D45A